MYVYISAAAVEPTNDGTILSLSDQYLKLVLASSQKGNLRTLCIQYVRMHIAYDNIWKVVIAVEGYYLVPLQGEARGYAVGNKI